MPAYAQLYGFLAGLQLPFCGSPSLHLAKPASAEGNVVSAPKDGGATEAHTPHSAGKNEPGSSGTEAEVQVGLTVTTSLKDDGRRNAVWKILNELATRVDDKDVSHIQLVVKVVLPGPKTQALIDQSREAGGSVNTTPL